MTIWKQFVKRKTGVVALIVVIFFCLIAIYAPFLASSKPFYVRYQGVSYFPLFRYLFNTTFYSKPIDIFFNLLMVTFPIYLIILFGLRRHPKVQLAAWVFLVGAQSSLFLYMVLSPPKDPSIDRTLLQERHNKVLEKGFIPSFQFELDHMNAYAKLNMLLRYRIQKEQHKALAFYVQKEEIPSVWYSNQENNARIISSQEEIMKREIPESSNYKKAAAKRDYLLERQAWLEREPLEKIILPPLSHFHWEEDAGGNSYLNQNLPWWHLTRINRKDLLSALIFGTRVSLVVGILAVSLSLMIGIPIGALAGYFGGSLDIFISRLLEIWESMPTFFMLLLVVAFLQSKSIFLVIFVISLFSWTSFSRYIRGEFLKQKSLPYVEACNAIGFSHTRIIFSHILPNAIPPVLTLVPFAIMAAITTEAALSFLGLGEEGSSSWGVLMDEGRAAFPGESYLLWPPSAMLTILLIAVALVGDALRDAFDPKMH